MSLLLDAMKKSGDNQPQSTGLSGGLSLEEHTPARPSTSSTTPASAPARAAGEALFAAKKKSGGFRWKLGLVPTTLIIALIFGSGYGYYVWLQLQPPSQPRVAQRPVTPPPAPVPAVAPPMLAATPPLVPMMPPQEQPAPPAQEKPAAMAQAKQALLTARNEDFDAPRSKPRTSQPNRHSADTSAVSVQRKVETDTITPALLNAYQAYQRGDYVTATQSYHEVLNKDEHNRDALLGLAAIAQQQRRDDVAQSYYRQLLVLNPQDPTAQAALLSFAPDSGDTESRLKTMLAEHPRSAALHFALGNYYADQSSWGDAQQSYFNARALEPTNAQYTFNLAISLDHLGQRKLAAQFYQQALQLDPAGNAGFDHAQAQQRLNELNAAH